MDAARRTRTFRVIGQAVITGNDLPRVVPGGAGAFPGAPGAAPHVTDVEVDRDTGEVKVLRYTTFQDVGLRINLDQVEGQMQGGAMQGIGWALCAAALAKAISRAVGVRLQELPMTPERLYRALQQVDPMALLEPGQ